MKSVFILEQKDFSGFFPPPDDYNSVLSSLHMWMFVGPVLSLLASGEVTKAISV